jgi:hypothetical protein
MTHNQGRRKNMEIGPINFRESARLAIQKYQSASMILDAIVWARIIGEYEKALEEKDNPAFDGTDGAHPAWWRGQDAGAKGVIKALTQVLDKGHVGKFGSPELEALATRVAGFRELVVRLADLKKE